MAGAGQTVTVACKLPNGLYLDLLGKDRVHIRGNAFPVGEIPDIDISSTFALTPNVDKEFWEAWSKANSELSVVKKGLIFAHGTDTKGVARERKSVVSGLERLDPSKPGKGLQKVTA